MAAGGQTVPYSFLEGLLNVLIVDPDETSLRKIADLLNPLSCVTIHRAVSTAEALTRLRGGKRFHCCITELGLDDVEDDEFYILRHYAQHCSVIVVTGSTSPRKGARCAYLGARAVFEKGASFDTTPFIETLTETLLINIVNHRYSICSNDTLSLATRVLLESHPQSVTEWADLMRITDRQLRNLWHTGSGFGVKHILFLYQCFNGAFNHFKTRLSGRTHDPETGNSRFTQRQRNYFSNNRELLTFILS